MRQFLLKLLLRLLGAKTITIGEFHNQHNPTRCEIYQNGQKKFIQQAPTPNQLVLTPKGFIPIKQSLKTVPYKVWKVRLIDNSYLECADEHLLLTQRGDVQAQDLKIFEDYVLTKSGWKLVVNLGETLHKENMYDLELEGDYHHYYTNDMVSHNTTTIGAFLLHYAMFIDNATVLIVSNKGENAKEVIKRIKFMYENLPLWLKPGITDDGWNKHTIRFDNGSSIVSQTTSETSGRGLSISLLFCHDGQNTVELQDDQGNIKKVTIEELYNEL